jgi:hypothetical protein
LNFASLRTWENAKCHLVMIAKDYEQEVHDEHRNEEIERERRTAIRLGRLDGDGETAHVRAYRATSILLGIAPV